jgi:hypothetical protein
VLSWNWKAAVPPELLRDAITPFVDCCVRIFGPNLHSVLLIGSGARGELSYRCGPKGELDMLSDVEFAVVTRRVSKRAEAEKLKQAAKEIEQHFGNRSPLFKVDFGVSFLRKFALTPPTFWCFEVKRQGKVLHGEDPRGQLPDVTLANLDLGNLRELILVRLWSMLLWVNEPCLWGRGSDYEKFILTFCYGRNLLDVLSIYLPHIGILEDGYARRDAALSKVGEDEFLDDHADLLRRAFLLKVKGEGTIGHEEAAAGFVAMYRTLADNLLYVHRPDRNGVVDRVPDRRAFRMTPIRRLRQFRIDLGVWRKYHGGRLRDLPRSLSADTRHLLIEILLSMHSALLPDEDSAALVAGARQGASTIMAVSPTAAGSGWQDEWLGLRDDLAAFMAHWFYARSTETLEDLTTTMKWRAADAG